MDGAMSPWFLLVIFLCLPFAIWLSLVLVGLPVSGWSLSLLWTCKPVSAPLGDQFSLGLEGCGSAQLLGADESQDLAPGLILSNPEAKLGGTKRESGGGQ